MKVDEGAEVKLSKPESADAVNECAAVSDGRALSLDGNAAAVVAESVVEEPAAAVPMAVLSGLIADSGKYVWIWTGEPEPSTTWTTETVSTTSVMALDSRSAKSR